MQRHAKSLQEKAAKCTVRPVGRGEFEVTSPSGETYLVTELVVGFQCVCEWARWHRTDFRPCAHCLAVEQYLERAGVRSLSFWTSEADAKRQHRPTRSVGVGLSATSRMDIRGRRGAPTRTT